MSEFRELIEKVENNGHTIHDLFPKQKIMPREIEIDLIEALEFYQSSKFIPPGTALGDRKLNVLLHVSKIHNELQEKEPDRCLIEKTIKRLTEWL